jgi:hypothetical protein
VTEAPFELGPVVAAGLREPVSEGVAKVVRAKNPEMAFAVGGLSVMDAADLADDGVDRPGREPPAGAAGTNGGRGQEQRVALLIGVAGAFCFEVVGDGMPGVAAEEDRCAVPELVQGG